MALKNGPPNAKPGGKSALPAADGALLARIQRLAAPASAGTAIDVLQRCLDDLWRLGAKLKAEDQERYKQATTDEERQQALAIATRNVALIHQKLAEMQKTIALNVRVYDFAIRRARRQLAGARPSMTGTTAANIRRQPERRPREARTTRRTTTRGASSRRSSDPPQPGEPPDPERGRLEVEAAGLAHTADSDLNIVWAEARERFETIEQFETLGSLCRIRAERMRGSGWERGRAA